jgi:hypothetical protein
MLLFFGRLILIKAGETPAVPDRITSNNGHGRTAPELVV